MKTITYKSAVDRWFYPVLVGAPFTLLVLLAALTGSWIPHLVVGTCVSLVVLVAVVPFTRPCEYRISDELLAIWSGFLKIQIPINSMRDVRKVKSWLAGPCLSINRVLIETNSGKEMVSPADRDAFIEEIERRRKKGN